MALILEGKTLCGICGKPITSVSDAIGFPAFLPPGHRLSRFSDGAFHAKCFDECVEREAVLNVLEKYRQIWQSRPANVKSLAEIEAWGKEAFRDLYRN
jgi:hypothetical protein